MAWSRSFGPKASFSTRMKNVGDSHEAQPVSQVPFQGIERLRRPLAVKGRLYSQSRAHACLRPDRSAQFPWSGGQSSPSTWWNHTFKVGAAPKMSSGAPITIVSAALSSSISSSENARVAAYTGFASSPPRKAVAE